MRTSILHPIAFLFLPLGAVAAPATSHHARLDEARAALAQVLAGDPSALDRTEALFAQLAEADPRDPVTTAYLAEALALRAWHANERAARTAAARAVTLADRALSLRGGEAPGPDEVARAAAFTYLAVARRDVLRAQLGDAGEMARAETLFARAAALSPADPLPLAYRGLCLALRAGVAGQDRDPGALVQESLSALDRALAMAGAPGQAGPAGEAAAAEARLVAGGVFIALPDEAYHRFDRGVALLQAELAAPGLDRRPPRLRAHLHYQSSLVSRRQGRSADEVSHLRAYVEVAPVDDPFATVARARLAELTP